MSADVPLRPSQKVPCTRSEAETGGGVAPSHDLDLRKEWCSVRRVAELHGSVGALIELHGDNVVAPVGMWDYGVAMSVKLGRATRVAASIELHINGDAALVKLRNECCRVCRASRLCSIGRVAQQRCCGIGHVVKQVVELSNSNFAMSLEQCRGYRPLS